MMEDLLLSHTEHEILQKHKNKIESRFKVKMNMPDVKSNDSIGSGEIIFANIVGDKQNIYSVKNFLKRKLEASKGVERQENNTTIIILDSDSEEQDILSESNTIRQRSKKARIEKQKIKNSTSSCSSHPAVSKKVPFSDKLHRYLRRNLKDFKQEPSSTTITIQDSDSEEEIALSENDANELKSKEVSTDIQEGKFSASSCNSDSCVSKNSPLLVNPLDESVIVIENTPSEDFIPLSSETKQISLPINDTIRLSSDEEDGDNEEIEEVPLPIIPRSLRPVVIDGSNVARAHGKPSNSFSCKGIKLSVEYFLKRGHPQVIAFVPRFRRFYDKGRIPTTDGHILDELEKNGNLTYTPSRRLNGKLLSSYDDRFILQLAADTEGVILSNDNFKDLVGEKEDFREVVENRLVMYCFAGDYFMIPSDPFGRNGPSIEEVLSYIPTEPEPKENELIAK